MCGRAAQTQSAVQAAAASLGIGSSSGGAVSPVDQHQTATATERQDNYNMSPGMDALVFWKDPKSGEIRCDRKTWGLVPRHGTTNYPLPTGMNQHFTNLMYNARSDTLYSKPTFARLASAGKTCLVALDGFFEWKQQTAGTKAGKKQPYFVHRKTAQNDDSQEKRPYLLMPGLWTTVATGRPDDPVLDTFTILTTEVCESLQWLHTRLPMTVWDETLARQWLEHPSEKVHRQLDEAAKETAGDKLAWHAVTTDMSSVKFRSAQSLQALPQMKNLKSFFGVAKKKDAKESLPLPSPSSKTKRPATTGSLSAVASPSKKMKGPGPAPPKKKKGSLDSFFAPSK